MQHLGIVKPGSTVYLYFDSFDGGDGSSITMSGLAVGDVQIYKDGGMTQRASTSGITLLDTDGIDFASTTGLHGFSVDLSDNSDAGFFAVGSAYWVIVASVTVDSQTVNLIAATFRIGPAAVVTGYPVVDVGAISGDTAVVGACQTSPAKCTSG